MAEVNDKNTPITFENSIGFLLRRVLQRHTVIFGDHIGHDITRPQMAALAWLYLEGGCSQNLLGRHIAFDASTIKGVVDRLRDRDLLEVSRDPEDRRRLTVDLSPEGKDLFEEIYPIGRAIADCTLEPLTADERETLFSLLRKLV